MQRPAWWKNQNIRPFEASSGKWRAQFANFEAGNSSMTKGQAVCHSVKDQDVEVTALRTEDDSGLVSCAFPTPRLAWTLTAVRDGVHQQAYEIMVAGDDTFQHAVAPCMTVESAATTFVPWPASPLTSREIRWWKVRVRTDHGWTAWSAPARIEGTLFNASEWQAQFISPLSNVDQKLPKPVSLLRRAFSCEDCVQARLYVTALGVHDVRVNGQPVGPDLLEPGWTDYRHRLLFSVYDILPCLKTGENVVSAMLGDGWWRGELTWMDRRANYGATTALATQIELTMRDGSRTTIVTDESWKGATGALDLAEIYAGVDMDFRKEPTGWRIAGFDDRIWENVQGVGLSARLEQRSMPGVRAVDIFEPEAVVHEGGKFSIDVGANLVGYLRLHARGSAGSTVRIRHAEMLESDGSLHVTPLRRARATDNYTLSGDEAELLEPVFTFHGFRFAEILISPGVHIERIEMVSIATDLDYGGRFACSNPSLNRLFENTVRSQRGNFLSIPTDCPQRDERLGWTGDLQVFCETACLNADARTFLASWLQDLATEQRADGNVTATVPNLIQGHEFEYGGVGWGDAATLVPWTLYMMYADQHILEQQYDSMRRWVEYCASRLDEELLWRGDFQLGDWLDPGAPPDRPYLATTDRDFVATAHLARSARVVGKVAKLLGHREASHFSDLGDRVAAAAWAYWSDDAIVTQTGCAIAIMFDIAPETEHMAIGAKLATLVRENEGRIATGFLGTPLVLPALTRTGQVDAAYMLLLNRQCPGWLYQIDRGATTMWERWDAVLPDGSLHGGVMAGEGNSMTSFNHYAYGAVCAWLYASVAGIAGDPDAPGFQNIRFEPKPGGGIAWASAKIVTRFGDASIDWNCNRKGMEVDLVIPVGATGTFCCPSGMTFDSGEVERSLLSGKHRLRLQVREDAPVTMDEVAR